MGTVLTQGDTFEIEGQTITIDAVESFLRSAPKINNAADHMPVANRVTATIVDHRLVITRSNTGTAGIAISETSGTPLQSLGILDAGGSPVHELTTGQDAQFWVNGAKVNRDSNKNLTDVIDGLTLNLSATSASPVTLDIVNDTEGPKAAIQDFIANTMKPSKCYRVQQDHPDWRRQRQGAIVDQKASLQATTWCVPYSTTCANSPQEKSPCLNAGNASYTYKGKTGVMDCLEDIGVYTSSRDNALSMIDEKKLDDLLEADFEKVQQLFRGIYDPAKGYQHGVANDFYNYTYRVSANMTGEVDRHIATITGNINRIETDMVAEQRRLDEDEVFLWNQFAAMEDAVARTQKELSWLTSQLGIG